MELFIHCTASVGIGYLFCEEMRMNCVLGNPKMMRSKVSTSYKFLEIIDMANQDIVH